MSYLSAVLVAEARRAGRAQRSAQLRHRHITRKPLGLLFWQLGAEPFTVAAAAWGFGPRDRNLVVPGEPRNRELAFRALLQLAREFNDWFEGGHGGIGPQIVVPNRGNLTMMGRLGRRLSYLSTEGDRPADPALVRFGLHMRFLAERARFPGQQLVLVLTELLGSHWVTELSPLEQQSLPAMDAAIEPPKGMSPHQAAVAAEEVEVGPLPTGDDDETVDPLISSFNQARAGRTDEKSVSKLRKPIEEHYSRMVFQRGWPLIWKCLERERGFAEAPSVTRRWEEDLASLEWHTQFVANTGGRYRTRDKHAQAARKLRSWEEAQHMVVAEEAIDDPIRMLPFFLSNEAIAGKVVSVDLDHTERKKKTVSRPRFVIETTEPCLVNPDADLYWTRTPTAAEYRIVDVQPTKGGSRVTLQHETGSTKPERPALRDEVVFSIHRVSGSPPLMLPPTPPWTHQAPSEDDSAIEAADADQAWE